MKNLCSFINPEEARVAKSYLEANGIDAFVTGEESLSVMPHIGMGAEAYQLFVHDEDHYRAKGLLEAIEQPEENKPQEPTSQVVRDRWIKYAILGIVGVYMVFWLLY